MNLNIPRRRAQQALNSTGCPQPNARWQQAKTAREALKQACSRLTSRDHRLEKAISRACHEFMVCGDEAGRKIALNAMITLTEKRSGAQISYMEEKAGLRSIYRPQASVPLSRWSVLSPSLAHIFRHSPLGGLQRTARA